MTRAILVDPHSRSTVEVDIGDSNSLQMWKTLMDIPRGLINIISLGNHVDMIVNDEGLFVKNQRFFTFRGLNHIFAGKSLLTSTDPEGETISLANFVTSDMLKTRIIWLGDAHEVEKQIKLGLLKRPKTTVNGETIWQWHPEDVS